MKSRLLAEYRKHYSYLLWRRAELEQYMERTLRDLLDTYRAAGVKGVMGMIFVTAQIVIIVSHMTVNWPNIGVIEPSPKTPEQYPMACVV